MLISNLLSLTISLSAVANAKIVYKSGDWVVDDSCVAYTTAKTNDKMTYALDVVIDKGGVMPLEVYIHPTTVTSPLHAFAVELERGLTYRFALLPREMGELDSYWAIPRDTDHLVNVLKNGTKFKVSAVGSVPADLTFSLMGSTATINELKKRCGTNSLDTAVEFEKAFIQPEAFDFDVLKLTPDQTERLRGIESQGVVAYRETLKIKTELRTLDDKFKAPLKDQAKEQQSLERTLSHDLAPLTKARSEAQTAIDTAQTDIKNFQATIVEDQGKLQVAQTEQQTANLAIQPFTTDHDRLSRAVQNAQGRLSSARQFLADTEAALAAAQQQAANLQNEEMSLRSQISSRRSELQSARAAADAAQAQLNNFDVRFEIQRRANGDWRLNSLQNEIQNLRQRQQVLEQQMRMAVREHEQKDSALRQCRSTPPNPNPPNCSQQQNELSQAASNLNSAHSNITRNQNELQSRMTERDRIMNEIQNDVFRQRDEMIARVAQLQGSASAIQSDIERMESRLRDIAQNQLPSLQNEIANLNMQRGAAAGDVRAAQGALAQISSEYANWKRSVNWDALKSRLDLANKEVANIQSRLKKSNQQITERETLIKSQTTKRDSLDKQITAVNVVIAKKEARLAEIAKSLEPYTSEKAAITARLQIALDEITRHGKDFAAQLPR